MSRQPCGPKPGQAERPERTELGPLRWPYVVFCRDEVTKVGEPAVCHAVDGKSWEYDGRRFLATDPVAGTRRTTPDVGIVPIGPWRHVPGCTCESCRLGDV